MVTTFYPPYNFGGDGVFVKTLAKDLAAAGHDVEVVHCVDAYAATAPSAPRWSDVPESEMVDGVLVHRLHIAPRLSPLITQQTGRPGLKHAALQRILNRDFDVINYHNISLIGGPGVLEIGRAAVKFLTLHEHWLVCPTHVLWKNRKEPCRKQECFTCALRSGVPPQLWRMGGFIQRSLAHVDLLLSPSQYTADRHRQGGISAPIRILHGYVDDLGGAVPRPATRPRFVYVGRLVDYKGIQWLADQFSRLPEYDLDVLGDGPLRKQLVERYGGCPWIRFRGVIDYAQLRSWYAGATALILPSLAPEVLGLCVLEAFSAGTPAIVSTAGGSPEAVESSGAGFVYTDPDSFGRAVHALARDPGLRRRLGDIAREAYAAHYTRETYLSNYLGIIAELTERKRTLAQLAGSMEGARQ